MADKPKSKPETEKPPPKPPSTTEVEVTTHGEKPKGSHATFPIDHLRDKKP